MPKALVIGASGQVGRNTLATLRASGWTATGTSASRPQPGLVPLDLTDEPALRAAIAAERPDAIVLASALTNVDRCEDEPALAHRVNAHAPAVIADAARAVGARVVYLSTEYVFDGTAGPYGEDDPVSPPCVYGATKLEGERAVLAADPRNLSLRTTVVFSFHPGDKNFAMQLLARLGAGERMKVPADQVSSPTWAPDLADVIVALLEASPTGRRRAPHPGPLPAGAGRGGRVEGGILNVAGPDVLSRIDLARRAARAFGFDETLLDPVPTSALGQKARRPLQAGLRVDRLRATGLPGPRGVDAALAEFARLARGVRQ